MLIRSFLILGVRHATIDNNSFTINMAAKMTEYNSLKPVSFLRLITYYNIMVLDLPGRAGKY